MENNKRKEYLTWDEYFMGIALLSATRSKDPSTQVGACIVKDSKIIGTGYNGATKGMDDDIFPWASLGELNNDIYNTKNPWVVHAELNAILNSNKDLKDSILYVTLFPCNECAKAIAQSGIKEIIYLRDYKKEILKEISKKILDSAGIIYRPYNECRNIIKEEVTSGIDLIQDILKMYLNNNSDINLYEIKEIVETLIDKDEKSKIYTLKK